MRLCKGGFEALNLPLKLQVTINVLLDLPSILGMNPMGTFTARIFIDGCSPITVFMLSTPVSTWGLLMPS